MRFSIETITPDTAHELLKLNVANRTIRPLRVRQYARAMLSGEWQLTGEPILMNGTKLLNGQHRLLACIEADIPFTTVVIKDVPDEVMTVIDSGLSRTISDVLGGLGKHNTHVVASAARLVLAWRLGIVDNSSKQAVMISRPAVVDFVEEHADEWQQLVHQAAQITKSIGMTNSVWTAVLFELSHADPDAVPPFVDRLIDGVGLDEGSPILALRSWCMNSVAMRRTRSRQEALIAITKAWNAYVHRQPMKMVKVLPMDTLPSLSSIS